MIEIKNLMPGEHEMFTYFDYWSAESALNALNNLENFLEIDGPYDGVIAFSQAVSLVSTWMIQQIKEGKTIESTFKCAVFLSTAAAPVDYKALQEGRVQPTTAGEEGEIIDIPTAHVWGVGDQFADQAKHFSQLCKADVGSQYVHGGGREIPGSGSKNAVTKSVNVIRRAIQLSDTAA
jgi:hypothetical protein